MVPTVKYLFKGLFQGFAVLAEYIFFLGNSLKTEELCNKN